MENNQGARTRAHTFIRSLARTPTSCFADYPENWKEGTNAASRVGDLGTFVEGGDAWFTSSCEAPPLSHEHSLFAEVLSSLFGVFCGQSASSSSSSFTALGGVGYVHACALGKVGAGLDWSGDLIGLSRSRAALVALVSPLSYHSLLTFVLETPQLHRQRL